MAPPAEPERDGHATSSAAARPAAPGRVRVVDSSKHGVFKVLRMAWKQPPLRGPSVFCAALCIAVLLTWQRSLYVAAHDTGAGGLSDTPPALLVVVAVVCRGAFSGMALLATHLGGWTGAMAERVVYGPHGSLALVTIAALQIVSLTLTVFAMARLEWRHALLFNPIAMFPPLAVLLSQAVFRSRKSWSWAALLIALTTLVVCAAMAADGLEPALLAHDHETVLSELGYSLTCAVASVLFCLSVVLWERYFYAFPTQPLYAATFAASVEVLLLPVVLLVDILPGVGFATAPEAALASFATLHRRVVDMPASIYPLIAAHTLLGLVVVPFVARAPAFTVLVFSGLPLVAAGAFPGGAIPVIIGGAYCFLVIMFLFVEDATYEAGDEHRLCRLVNRQVSSVAWRHGCAVLAWVPRQPVPGSEHPPSRGPSRTMATLQMLGVAPASISQMGVVLFSARAFAGRFANDWRGVSYERLAATNADDEE